MFWLCPDKPLNLYTTNLLRKLISTYHTNLQKNMPRAFRGQNPIIFLTTSQSQYLFFLSFSFFLLLISFMQKISLKLQKIHFLKNWDSLHAKLNSHYKAWSYRKRKHKKIKAYRQSLSKEPIVKTPMLILDLTPLRSQVKGRSSIGR